MKVRAGCEVEMATDPELRRLVEAAVARVEATGVHEAIVKLAPSTRKTRQFVLGGVLVYLWAPEGGDLVLDCPRSADDPVLCEYFRGRRGQDTEGEDEFVLKAFRDGPWVGAITELCARELAEHEARERAMERARQKALRLSFTPWGVAASAGADVEMVREEDGADGDEAWRGVEGAE